MHPAAEICYLAGGLNRRAPIEQCDIGARLGKGDSRTPAQPA